MRTPGFIATIGALRRGAVVVAFGGLLAACSAANGPTSSTSGGATGAGASGGTAGLGQGGAGGAAGSTAAGGDGAGGDGAGGTGGAGGYNAGGAAGAGTGGDPGAGGVGGSSGFGGSAGVGGTGGVGGSGGTGGSATGGTGGTGGTPANVVCHNIINGTSSVTVNGATRNFLVQLPGDTSHMALLFLWHGWMQKPADFMSTIVYDVPSGQWVPFNPNAFPMPLMIVTPFDTKMIPPNGLDWDIKDGNKDFPYFDAMLQCIHQQFNIDDSRIYSFGFSAGAVFTDLLSAQYPHTFAATISESGMWMNDKPEQADIQLGFIMNWQWPAFNPADRGNVLLTHGGPNDYATVADLEKANQQALPFLYNNGRTVMECAHTFGHTLDPDLTQGMYYQYMWAHQLGGPPLGGMLPGFPTGAQPVGATACTFHPYP